MLGPWEPPNGGRNRCFWPSTGPRRLAPLIPGASGAPWVTSTRHGTPVSPPNVSLALFANKNPTLRGGSFGGEYRLGSVQPDLPLWMEASDVYKSAPFSQSAPENQHDAPTAAPTPTPPQTSLFRSACHVVALYQSLNPCPFLVGILGQPVAPAAHKFQTLEQAGSSEIAKRRERRPHDSHVTIM